MKKKERITFIQIALLLIFAGMILIPVFVISNRKSLDNSTPAVKKINPEHNTSTDSSISKVNSKKDSITNKKRQMEFLDRGLIAQQVKGGVFLSWRSLGTDSDKISFNVLRNGKQINIGAIDGATNFIDTGGNVKDSYSIQVMDSRKLIETVDAGDVWPLRAAKVKRKPSRAFKELLLSPPQHKGFEYIPGDMSVGDLDGDGRYELIFEWEGQEPFIEAIDLDGKSLWRIFCGPNVRAHKTGFLVYDFDGDGRAEVACKTGPGTKDGKGKYLSKGPAAKDDDQMIVDKPGYHLIEDHAYITVFDGLTGVELDTVRYEPALGERSKMKENWGDNRGYRAASIKAAVLCTKENGPLMVFTRGIHTRIAMGAFKWDGQKIQKCGTLTLRIIHSMKVTGVWGTIVLRLVTLTEMVQMN
ncbi:MAG: hypothetical protein NE327_15095 [Lentisphaeraceae bacterium]|nr:hypothetical protein [Lentisphaeraceae bacterium]